MAWIESHQNLRDHPKAMDLMGLMGWDLDTTIGKLFRFWWWCVDYAEDGDLRRHNESRIAGAMGVPSTEAVRLVAAMVQARFLDQEPYFRVHDWWDYTGPWLRSKYKRSPDKWMKVRAMYATGTSLDTYIPTTKEKELKQDSCQNLKPTTDKERGLIENATR